MEREKENQLIENESIQKKQLEEEYTEWEKKSDPEPKRDQEVIESRAWMEKEGISFVPFYKILDFTENLDDSVKNRLEEALYRMGILDACVVPEHLKQKVLDHPDGMRDTFLFSQPDKIKQNLTDFLEISMEQTDIVFYQQLTNCLMAIVDFS